MKIIDKYILKRYLSNFFVMLLMFIPIGIIIDVSEKVDKMVENEIPFSAIALYYFHFTIYFANLLFPIFLFLSIIWFTSKLANNTEIIAILSSGISFTLHATRIATNILKHDAKLLEQNQVHTLQTFLQAAQGKDRNKITQGQCFKIMNIGTQINRKLFKKVKAHK